MIHIRLQSVGEKNPINLDISHGELLSDAVERSVGHVVPEGKKANEIFSAFVNGNKIDSDLWKFVGLNKPDTVLICPAIRDGDSGQLLKSAAMIAITIAAYSYLGPGAGGLGLTGLSLGSAMAAVSIGTSLLLNALIPPPVPEGLDGLGDGSLANSQMYSVTGQSNQTRKYGTVPKVYGTHRIYPTIAATPYTELLTDPATGKIVQYFYAIYDFGLGPLVVNNIKIGDTPISDFADVSYRLVDINRPETSEGPWDDNLFDNFELYKGDFQQETVSVALNNDQGVGEIENWEAIRNASPNTAGVPQEITVNLVNPQGLYSVSSSGNFATRSIELDIFFSKVGEDIWRGFNDLNYVERYEDVGGDDIYRETEMGSVDPTNANTDLVLLRTNDPQYIYDTTIQGTRWSRDKIYGFVTGTTQLKLESGIASVGDNLYFLGNFVGKVTTITSTSPAGYSLYSLAAPTTFEIGLWIRNETYMFPNWIFNSVSEADKIHKRYLAIGRTKITRNTLQPNYSVFKFTPKEAADYKVKVTRVLSYSGYTSTVQDQLLWNGLSSRFDRSPITTDKRHVFLELKIRATNQLNGSIQNLSAVCSSVLEVYDPGPQTWSKQVTSSPPWIFADLLTGEVNKRPIAKSRLHTNSLLDWRDFCEQIPTAPPSQNFVKQRFSCNFVLDYTPTLQSILNQVCNSSQASLNLIDGKYGVLLDTLKTVPVQVFTPRNYKNFSSTRNYSTAPHALKVSFIDPGADWEQREAIVYDDGYDAVTAEVFEEVTSFGITNYEQAWRLGRYMAAQNRLRQETISIEVDFENLVCTRGDYVQFCQDAMKAGGTPARVKTISGNQITIDEGIETGPYSYGYVFRAVDGNIYTNTLTPVDSETFDLDGTPLPQVGDLIVIGEVGQIVMDCLVKSIDPGSDLTATITLVEKADAIYDAESTDTLPDYVPLISDTQNTEFKPPGEVIDLIIADSYYECNGSGLSYFVTIDWDVPSGAVFETFEIYVDSGEGYNLEKTTKESFYTYLVEEENLGVEHKFKVLAVSATGKKLDLGAVGEVTQTVSRKSTPPDNVQNLYIDITNEVLQLVWDQVADCAVEEYLIRYSPSLTATWEQSIPLLRAPRNATLAAAQARTGTYLIKAIDWEGNESLVATSAITTIPELFNLNIIDTINDFPALAGPKDRTVADGSSLTLKHTISGGVDTAEYYSEGYYYYSNLLDLGDIYTVRLQSLLEAEGFTLEDLMSNWTTLSDLDAMSHALFSDWDLEAQYRTTDQYNVMSAWTTLSSVTSMSDGSPDIWTEWKKFTISDATGRIFAFRLKLISNKVNVTPRVFDGTIKADMPDREDSFNNLSAPSSGLSVAYTPSFYGPGTTPNIQISLQNGAAGDYWSFDYKTLDGFYIRFFNSGGSPVSRSFDARARGYGYKATAII
jgi:hypothetical protein